MKRFALPTLSLGVVFALLLIVNPSLFSDCPKQKPYPQLCPEPPTVTKCNQSINVPCNMVWEYQVSTGNFGCQDNSPNKTQCLTGTKQSDMVKCNVKFGCVPGAGPGTCQLNVKHCTFRDFLISEEAIFRGFFEPFLNLSGD